MQNYIQPQPYNRFNQFQNGYKVLPITSENDITNTAVDFNGSPTYFHNQNSNEIYVKQFDVRTGVTTTQKFIKADNAQQDIRLANSDLGINTPKDDLKALNERLNGLEQILTEIKMNGGRR